MHAIKNETIALCELAINGNFQLNFSIMDLTHESFFFT